MQNTSLMDILPLLVEASTNAKTARDNTTQAKQKYEMQKLTDFNGYSPTAKEGLLDSLANKFGYETANYKSAQANKAIDEMMQSNFGKYDYLKPDYTSTPLDSAIGLKEGAGQALGVLGQMASDVYNSGLKPLGNTIANGVSNSSDVLSQMASDAYNGITDSGTVNNGIRDVNYNYYAGKYPKQKGESDQAYIERLKQISLTE